MNETNQNAYIVQDPASTNAVEELRDIKPPVDIPNDWDWLLWTLLSVALGVLLFWLWRYWQKRRMPKKAPVIVIPAHVRARQRLREAMQWIADPKRFCIAVSDAIRIYLAERFDLHAPDRTTEEFLAELRASSALNGEQKALLGRILETCDLVKFAKFEPPQSELESMHTLAHRLIDDTEPSAPVKSEPEHPDASLASKENAKEPAASQES